MHLRPHARSCHHLTLFPRGARRRRVQRFHAPTLDQARWAAQHSPLSSATNQAPDEHHDSTGKQRHLSRVDPAEHVGSRVLLPNPPRHCCCWQEKRRAKDMKKAPQLAVVSGARSPRVGEDEDQRRRRRREPDDTGFRCRQHFSRYCFTCRSHPPLIHCSQTSSKHVAIGTVWWRGDARMDVVLLQSYDTSTYYSSCVVSRAAMRVCRQGR